MELTEFIEESLISICKGIDNAKLRYEDEYGNCPIAPARVEGTSVILGHNSTIEFEVAVTTTETKKSSANGKAGIKVLSVGVNGENTYDNINASKIKFSIPFYPQATKSRKDL